MFEPDPSFRAVHTRDGYPPLEDLGLIGDGSTVALIGVVASGVTLARARAGARA